MAKFDGVLLVSDYDDTLYGTNLSVSAENRAAIAWFTAQGGIFSVATGRAHNTFAPQISRERLLLNAPVILSNGCSIYDFTADRYLVQTYLPQDCARHLARLAEAFPQLGFEAYHGDDIYVYNGNAVTWAHLERVGTAWTECPIQEMPLPWSKVLIQQEQPEILLQAREYLLAHWGDSYEAIFSNRRLLELTAKGSNKGTAVQWLARYLNIDPAHVYCIGDNQNDLPMLAVSAIPFAPSNCAQEVKDHHPRLVGSCDEHCVAQVIEILDGLYPG